MECVTSIVGKIGDSLYAAVERQLGYLIHYNDNVENFRKQIEKLGNLKERVQGKIDAAKRDGKIIEKDVEKWMNDVEEATVNAKNFFAEEEKANTRCLNRLRINFISRKEFSKQAKDKTGAISVLQDEGKFEIVYRDPPPPGIKSSSTHLIGAFESRQSIMKQVMELLIDENIHMIGICGMGGIGKTTMVEEIGKKAKDEKLFDAVGMAVVTQTQNLKNIQQEIADSLGGSNLQSDSVKERASSLRQRMQQKRILVILDDIWEGLDLGDVGIPFGQDHKGCKIILTSRSKDACEEMDAERIVSIDALSKEESWSLFKEIVDKAIDSADINSIAREVAAECGGLPIAILTVGRALRNRGKRVWIDAARQLKKSVPTYIPGMDAKVFSRLKLSYDYLKTEELKSFFLLCSLFPEDYPIPVEALARYGMVLRLFNKIDTLEEARGRAQSMVSTLIFSFLLLDGNKKGRVKMHDLVRDVALSIATKDKNVFLVKANAGLREWPNNDTFDNLTAISLMSNDIHDEIPDVLECPKLQVLLLLFNSSLVIPNNFFHRTTDLKVLDMSSNNLLSVPQSIQSLGELRMLRLDFCKLGDISAIGKLIKLEILSFSNSDIKEIPEHFSQLTYLRIFDLNDCRALKFISHGVISSLRKLEELYMRNSFQHWDTEDEENSRRTASLLELNSLTRLTSLHICIPDARLLPNEMEFQKLAIHTISIGNGTFYPREYSCSRILNLTLDMPTRLLDCVKNLLKRSEKVNLSNCIGLRNIFPEIDEEFIELKILAVKACKKMKYLLDTTKVMPQFSFHRLERLIINELLNFCQICHGELPPESFSNVQLIEVRHCPKMPSILSSELLQRFRKIKEITATNCDSLPCAFDLEGLVIENEETKFLSMLEKLNLQSMLGMTHIWRGSTHLVSLCNLKTVILVSCGKLRILFPPALVHDLVCLVDLSIAECGNLKEIFTNLEVEEEEKEEIVVWKKHPNVIPCFKHLTSIYIRSCLELTILFTRSITGGLVQLNRLTIKSCPKLQEIVVNEEGEAASMEKIVFPNFHYMTLEDLDGLTSFYPGHHTIEWPALDDLEIISCPKLQTFGNGLHVTPKLKKVRFGADKECWMGDLHASVNHIFKEEELALQKNDVYISKMPESTTEMS